MKISKSRIKQIISESLNKILNEEDKEKETTSSEAGLQKKKTHFQSNYGANKVLKMGIGKISDDDLKKEFEIWKKNNTFHLISKSDPKYKNIKDGGSCVNFSIKQKDIDDAKKGTKDAQKGKKDT